MVLTAKQRLEKEIQLAELRAQILEIQKEVTLSDVEQEYKDFESRKIEVETEMSKQKKVHTDRANSLKQKIKDLGDD